MKKLCILGVLGMLACRLMAADTTRIRVVDSLSGEALLNARAELEKGEKSWTSDQTGVIQVILAPEDPRLVRISAEGYHPKFLHLGFGNTILNYGVSLVPEAWHMDEVEVTASRTNSRIDDIPTRVEVLGLDDVNEENGIKPGNVMSLLGDIAGIQMQQVSASSGNTYARIQGLNGRYTQILRDGVPLYTGLSGGFGILQIPPLDLKQIEIIKGSSSTLYGGDAIGGIINMVTKMPSEKQELSFTLNRSTLRESNANFYAAKKYRKFGYTFFGGQTLQNQVDVNGDGFSDVPIVNNRIIHPKLVFYTGKKSRIILNYTNTYDVREGGDMRYLQSERKDSLYFISNHMQRHAADIRFQHEFNADRNLTVKMSGGLLEQKLETKYYDFHASHGLFYNEISYFTRHGNSSWVLGMNFNGDLLRNRSGAGSDSVVTNYSWRTFGVFVQNTWKFSKRFTMESGFRSDLHSQYGFFPLPRLSLMYKANRRVTARINGGLGYKSPNLITYTNPETDLNKLVVPVSLKAEKSASLNADVNYQNRISRKWNVEANQSFFFTRLNAPVVDTSTDANKRVLLNAAKPLSSRGAQTYFRLQAPGWELYLGYVLTLVKKEYDAVHPRPTVTPRHNVSTVIVKEVGEAWKMGVEASWISGQLDQGYAKVPSYLLAAAMIQYTSKKWAVVLNGENLLDYRQNRGRAIYTGTRINPIFNQLWAPIDGRVINLSFRWKL